MEASGRLFCVLLLLLAYVSLGVAQSMPPIRRAISDISAALRNHETTRALQLSRLALKKWPQDPRVWTLLGMAHTDAGDTKLALSAYQSALHYSPNYLPALEAAAQLEYQRDGGDARKFIKSILKLEPANTTAHAMLGTIDFKGRDCPGAIDHFRQAGSMLDDQPDVLEEYGVCLAQMGRFGEAVPLFQRVDALRPGPVPAYNLALAQWNAKQTDDAIKTLSPLASAPNAPESILRLAASIYESRGETQRAVELLRKAILAHPKGKGAYLDFADLSVAHDSFQVGIDMLNAGIRQLPRQAELYLARGILYCELGKMNQGMADFETADGLNPDLSAVGAAQGIAESQEHNSAKALATFREQARRHPDNALTQYLLAEALSERDNHEGTPEYEEEIRAANRAIQLDPALTGPHDLLATLYLRNHKISEAAEQCRAALRIDPKDEQALYHLVLALRTTGRQRELSDTLKKLVGVRSEKRTQMNQKKPYLVEGPASQTAPRQ